MNADTNERWSDAGSQWWATTALEEHMGDTGAGFRSVVAMRAGTGREGRQGSGGKASEAYPSARAGEEHGRRVFARGESAIAEWFSLGAGHAAPARVSLASLSCGGPTEGWNVVRNFTMSRGKGKRYWSLTAAASDRKRMRSSFESSVRKSWDPTARTYREFQFQLELLFYLPLLRSKKAFMRLQHSRTMTCRNIYSAEIGWRDSMDEMKGLDRRDDRS